jgi:hypothetical protein
MSRPTPNENDRGAIVTPGDVAAVEANTYKPRAAVGKAYVEYRIKAIARFYPKGLVATELRSHGEFQGKGDAEKFVMTDLWKFDLTWEAPGCGFTTSSKPFSLRISKEEVNELFLDALQRVTRMVYDHALINLPEGELY